MLLQAAAAVAPRGLYVCGNTSSSAGLTVSVAKDAMTGQYVLEVRHILVRQLASWAGSCPSEAFTTFIEFARNKADCDSSNGNSCLYV